ncbi:MAG: DUF1570 domain-containing protein [Vicinamibacterales bacterium]
MRRVIVALGVLTCLPGRASPAGADLAPLHTWQRVESPHFHVLGDAGAGALRRAAERMEQLHLLLESLGPSDRRAPDTTVLVFRDRTSYRPFLPIYNGAVHEVGGYFQPGPMNYITMIGSLDGADHSVALHEYVHLVINRTLGDAPSWLGEGLAEFYSTVDIANRGQAVRVGDVPPHHVNTLRRGQMPVGALVRVTRDSPDYNERERSTVFYAQSWALVHYLQLGNGRAYTAAFPRFVEALAAGTPFAQACEEILGVAPDTLDAQIRRYVARPGFPTATLPLPAPLREMERLDATPVAEASVHAVLGDLLRLLDGRPDARAHLERALELDATESLALGTLALLNADAGRLDEAERLATRPAGSPTFLSEYYRAMALDALTTDPAAVAPLIEAALRESVRLNPTFAEAHVELSRHLDQREEARDEAMQLVRRAIALAPVRDDYRLQLARLHLLARDTSQARVVLDPLAERGSSDRIRAGAREYLTTALEIDLARIEPPAAPPAARESGPGPEESGGGPPPPSNPPGTAPDPPGGPAPPAYVLQLRPVRAGERQVFGTWSFIECIRGNAVTLVARVGGRDLRLRAARMASVDFVSYRAGGAPAVGCGPQRPIPVLVTYRPGASGSTAGEAVAIEFMPPDYRPR